MSDDAVRWLHRRASFGLPIDALRRAEAAGVAAELDSMFAMAQAAEVADPWDDAALPMDPRDPDARRYAIATWLSAMVTTERPLVERTAWMWHGHFVSALDKVRTARFMVDQIRLFRRSGLGRARELLSAVTTDPAMLVYLDLRTSTAGQPNENFARELLELFALGEGAYTEADVQAGAAALTGWTVTKEGAVRLVPRRHDDSAHRFLGVDGVHDLDTVIDAVLRHGSFAPFISGVVASEFLGSAGADTVASLSDRFARSDHDLGLLVRAALEAGIDASQEMLSAPVPWLVTAMRVTGSSPNPRQIARHLRTAGQLPMLPPNVAGWPGGAAWLASSSVVARANLAALVAAHTPDGEVLAVASGDAFDELSDVLGLYRSGFSDDTVAALRAAPGGPDRLAVALLSPEFLIA
ncbi:MAG: DUF1800 family protein [Actinobacteria bacterium]|nr:DUF1800 family protein [Actinomycetota bacterium]